MFFTHIGRVIAVLLLVLAVFQIVLGFMIANDSLGPYQPAVVRYGVKSSGQLIDRGIYAILVAVGLGVLTEIAFALRAIKNSQASVGAPNAPASGHSRPQGTI